MKKNKHLPIAQLAVILQTKPVLGLKIAKQQSKLHKKQGKQKRTLFC